MCARRKCWTKSYTHYLFFSRFPTVDFHMATQRLAVGTNEGAVIMYDLKTAIRLYVLDGHAKQITACSFSTDGRRLVTISLGESLVLVWKVGSSFASFFNPGAPPRQGHGGSQPFKTLNFNIGADGKLVPLFLKNVQKAVCKLSIGVFSGDMTTAETLDFVRVEWIADRSVKVRIRQSILTFST
jgi:WD40 repeat protein